MTLIYSYLYTEIKIFSTYLSYNLATQRGAYVRKDPKQIRDNGGEERKAPMKLP